MNEEELKNGCGIEWNINNKHTGEFCCKFVCGKGRDDGFKAGYWKQEDDLCDRCKTELKGFQEGKTQTLEKVKEKIWNWFKKQNIYIMGEVLDEEIKELLSSLEDLGVEE